MLAYLFSQISQIHLTNFIPNIIADIVVVRMSLLNGWLDHIVDSSPENQLFFSMIQQPFPPY